MKKILNMLLAVVLSLIVVTAIATEYDYSIRQSGETTLELIVSGVKMLHVPDYVEMDIDTQSRILKILISVNDHCVNYAKWAEQVAIVAKFKMQTQEFFLEQLKLNEDKMMGYLYVDSQRTVRDAFRVGYEDPAEFGFKNQVGCIELLLRDNIVPPKTIN